MSIIDAYFILDFWGAFVTKIISLHELDCIRVLDKCCDLIKYIIKYLIKLCMYLLSETQIL